MATFLSTWEQTGQYDPTNPDQKTYAYYTGIPGGYSSFYYNRVPTTAVLQGNLGTLDPSTWPAWAQALGVGLFGLALGFAGMKYGRPLLQKRLGK